MKEIRDLIDTVIQAMGLEGTGYVVEHPGDEEHGDFSTNVALQLKTKDLTLKTNNPRELAEGIKAEILKQVQDEDLDFIEKIEVAGPGFINFYLSKEFLTAEMQRVNDQGDKYGTNQIGEGKKVIVEYSSPNIAKPFTVGHLRSTVIGDAIANLLMANGWQVKRDNHLGDWGTQFGKQIVALKELGKGSLAANLAELEKSNNPVKYLVDLYVEFHQRAESDPALEEKGREWFTKLEKGDIEARELWQKCVDWSWVEFAKIYERLGIKFSEEFNGGRGLGEAYFEDKMGEVLEILDKQEWYREGQDGAKLVFFPEEKYPPAMIVKKDGSTLYATRDLATDWYRKKNYQPDLIVNEVGAEQSLYFKQLYEIEQMLGWYERGQRVHVGHGMYRFAEGKMSTRKGNVIWLEEVLEEAVSRASGMQKEEIAASALGGLAMTNNTSVAEMVGIGALKWNDLKGEAKRDIVFDWEMILSMKGNSGPYMQYTVVRARSVLAKASKTNIQDLMFNIQINPEELAVLRWVYRYPEVVLQAGKEFAPHLVATYLYELAQRFNSFYNKHSILLVQNEEQKEFSPRINRCGGTNTSQWVRIVGDKSTRQNVILARQAGEDVR